MPRHDLIPSLLFKLNENQLAIAAAVEELSNWVEARGALATFDASLEFITQGIAELTVRQKSQEEEDPED